MILLTMTAFIMAISCSEDPIEDTLLHVSPSLIEFEAVGGSSDLHIASNSAWFISNTSDWCLQSTQGSEGDATVTVTALANSDKSGRSTTILIIAGDISRELEVNQKGSVDTTDPLPVFTYEIPPDDTDMREITSIELSQQMGVGWNIGNTLDAIGGETNWGCPIITKNLIDSVKANGFNAIRVPVAWSKFSDESTFTIEISWMERVEEVVNYILDNDMYAIVNIHWDGGWMQPTYEDEEYVNTRLAAMWQQIARHFRDYNDHLLFAGTNEVLVDGDYGTPKQEYYTVQNGYNQTFVTTVRKTGGRNAYRHLVVQGFNTNIDYTVSYAVMPEDVVDNRLMMEVHYYDPYNFTLNENSNITQWGENAEDPSHVESWANETWADSQFQKMKTHFIDKGYAVILGEYGAMARTNVDHHAEYRRYYIEYITHSLVDHGLVPFYWDAGYFGNYGSALFNRQTGEVVEPALVEAIVSALD
jgi:endoglucanase